MGIGRNDRVGIVLSNGPEMATAFMAVAAGTTSAPLNPAYRGEEFEFYLSDLHAKALIVEQGSTSPAIEVAKKLGVAIVELRVAEGAPAGQFTLHGSTVGAPAHGGMAQPDDVALVLHTSGTTSRPKIVPLSQRNVCASARHIRETLHFSPQDRGLNIMPLFHIHGLIAAMLAPISAG
ncbi:MAG: long-chain fatty acid--CoA ligase, partial [Betaproteobacteria bacterium]|nr:long-chain fatty acid--CoA ligase [Betaproteobacteria bacterium]